MATDISAPFTNNISFSISETDGNKAVTLSDSLSVSNNYTYNSSGVGFRKITNALAITGVLDSGLSTQIDLYSLDQKTISSTQSVQLTGIKNITFVNTSTTEGYDFAIQATGSNACTNLFNGGSGNLLVKPYSFFSYNDPYSGFVVSSSQRYVYLNDHGSGVNYKMFVFGLD